MKQRTLNTIRPADVAVLLHSIEYPGASYPQIASVLGISMSTAHGAHQRLVARGLVHRVGKDEQIVAAIEPMLEFLLSGFRYVFFAPVIPRARGVPTGLSSPALAQLAGAGVDEESPLVWPSHLGETMGVGIVPLVPDAPSIAHRDPRMYAWLAAMDALRVGDARVREIARQLITKMAYQAPSARR